ELLFGDLQVRRKFTEPGCCGFDSNARGSRKLRHRRGELVQFIRGDVQSGTKRGDVGEFPERYRDLGGQGLEFVPEVTNRLWSTLRDPLDLCERCFLLCESGKRGSPYSSD